MKLRMHMHLAKGVFLFWNTSCVLDTFLLAHMKSILYPSCGSETDMDMEIQERRVCSLRHFNIYCRGSFLFTTHINFGDLGFLQRRAKKREPIVDGMLKLLGDEMNRPRGLGS